MTTQNPIQRNVGELARAQRGPLRFDFLLAAAVIGLLACSLVTIQAATTDDVPGQPHFYLYRQLAYAIVGLGLMFALSRIDYSRLRELKYGLYVAMIGRVTLVILVGSTTR
ncbi:MAG: FtsW/RodA/SpoVE family cell cycle protein, partial [Solirubrobacteraceae bacterium]